MPRVLVFWTVIIAVVAAALIWRAVRQRRSMPRPDPGCSADDAWTHYFTGAGSLNERDRRAIGAFPSLGAEAGEAIRERVTSVVESACRSEDPQTALRIALMDATDRFVLGETVHEARHADHGA